MCKREGDGSVRGIECQFKSIGKEKGHIEEMVTIDLDHIKAGL